MVITVNLLSVPKRRTCGDYAIPCTLRQPDLGQVYTDHGLSTRPDRRPKWAVGRRGLRLEVMSSDAASAVTDTGWWSGTERHGTARNGTERDGTGRDGTERNGSRGAMVDAATGIFHANIAPSDGVTVHTADAILLCAC